MRPLSLLQVSSFLLIALVCVLLDAHFGRSVYELAVIDPVTAAAVASTAVSFLGNLFGLKSSSDANRTNIQLAREAQAYDWRKMNAQNEWSESMYNKYQSPKAMSEQLLQAGINPALALTDMSTGSFSAGQGGSPEAARVQPYDFSRDAEAIGSSVNAFFANQKTQAEARKANAEASQAEVSAAYAESDKKQEILERMQRLSKDSIEYRILAQQLYEMQKTEKNRIQSASNQNALEEASHDWYRQQIRESEDRMLTSELSNWLKVQENSREWIKLDSLVKETNASIIKMMSEKNVNDAQVNYLAEKIKDVIEDVRGKKLPNDVKQQYFDLIKDEFQSGMKASTLENTWNADPRMHTFGKFWDMIMQINVPVTLLR